MKKLYWPVRHGDLHNTDYLPIDGTANLYIYKKLLENIPTSTVAVYDKKGSIYIATLNAACKRLGTLWSFDSMGEYRWHSNLPNPSLTSPAVDTENNIYVCDGIHLFKFSNTGECIWQVSCPIETSAITFVNKNLILLLGIDASLRIYDLITGIQIIPTLCLPTSTPNVHLGHKEMPRKIFIKIFTLGVKNIGVSKKHYKHITQRFFGKNVAAKHVPAVLSNNDILILCQGTNVNSSLFYILAYNNEQLIIKAVIEIGPGCDTSPTVSADESLAFIIDRNGVLYAIDLQMHQLAWTKSLPNASSASPNITPDNLLYVSIKTHIFCFKVNKAEAKLIWNKSFLDMAKEHSLSHYDHYYINSVLALTEKFIYAVGAFGNIKTGGFYPKIHYLFILDRITGACCDYLQLSHESFCTLSIMPDGTLLIPSKPFYLGVKRVLNMKTYLPFIKKTPFYGLTILKPKEMNDD